MLSAKRRKLPLPALYAAEVALFVKKNIVEPRPNIPQNHVSSFGCKFGGQQLDLGDAAL
jgi:hypothetical protein